MPSLQILHFNDVYHLLSQKHEPVGGAARFATVVKEFRKNYGIENSYVFFSGDAFNPSVESSISKGLHMVPSLNDFGLDAACLGNHDFDFGLPTLKGLISLTNFPWLLSNVVDSKTDESPAGSKKFVVLEKGGLKLGIVGLVEKEWLETIPNLPSDIQYKDFVSVGKELSTQLRDPNGPHAVDLVIALTHYEGETDDSKDDDGVRVVKSGTDFRELSIVELDIDETTNEEGRTHKRIQTITVTSSIVEDEHHANLVASETSEMRAKMSKPIAYTMTHWDCRSSTL
ncbi:52_t:CDS:2, partial [Racocetra fulgida]